MFAPKKILVPTDFSSDSDAALKEAVDLAKQYHSQVYLLHVSEPIMQCSADYCLDLASLKMAEAEELDRARVLMQQELDKLGIAQEVEVIRDFREGDTVAEILKEEDEKDIDLIVMPSHRKRGLIDRMMSPVSRKVTESSTRPVLIVHH